MTLELGKTAMCFLSRVPGVNKVGCLMCVCAQIQNTHENVKWCHLGVEVLAVAPVMASTLLTCAVNYIKSVSAVAL